MLPYLSTQVIILDVLHLLTKLRYLYSPLNQYILYKLFFVHIFNIPLIHMYMFTFSSRGREPPMFRKSLTVEIRLQRLQKNILDIFSTLSSFILIAKETIGWYTVFYNKLMIYVYLSDYYFFYTIHVASSC